METPIKAETSWTPEQEKRIAEILEEKQKAGVTISRIDAIKLMKAEQAIKEHRPKARRKATDATGISDDVKARLAKKKGPRQAPLVTRYRASAKQATKALLEKETQAAKLYRLIAKAKGDGVTYEEIVKNLDRKGLNNDPTTRDNCLRWYISKLKSGGFVLSSSEREAEAPKQKASAREKAPKDAPKENQETPKADNRLANVA